MWTCLHEPARDSTTYCTDLVRSTAQQRSASRSGEQPRDAQTLLPDNEEMVCVTDASRVVALLASIAGQDVEPAAGSDGTDCRWVIARKVAPDRVSSVVDSATTEP